MGYVSALLLILLYSPVILFAFVHCRSLLAQLSPANVFCLHSDVRHSRNTAPRNTHKSVRASMTWIRIGRKKKNQASEGSFGLVENCDGKIFVWLLSQRWHVERFRKRDLWPYSNQGRWGLWLTPSHPHRPEECCRKHIRWQCGSDPHCSLAIFQPATLSFCKCLFTTIKKKPHRAPFKLIFTHPHRWQSRPAAFTFVT